MEINKAWFDNKIEFLPSDVVKFLDCGDTGTMNDYEFATKLAHDWIVFYNLRMRDKIKPETFEETIERTKLTQSRCAMLPINKANGEEVA